MPLKLVGFKNNSKINSFFFSNITINVIKNVGPNLENINVCINMAVTNIFIGAMDFALNMIELCTYFHLYCVRPVSYTHLDVYKRQHFL